MTRIDHLTTSGTFSLDGGTWEVENNVWIVGDDHECIVFDGPHTAQPIVDAVQGRNVKGVLCTHGHDDHICAAREVAQLVDAPTMMHPADNMLWRSVHQDTEPDQRLHDGQKLVVAGVDLIVHHTPGHSPGSCSIYCPDLGAVFSGDTLFAGGPGATGKSFSSFDVIIASITEVLFGLPEDTTVFTGHGDTTTIGSERPQLDEWIKRGH